MEECEVNECTSRLSVHVHLLRWSRLDMLCEFRLQFKLQSEKNTQVSEDLRHHIKLYIILGEDTVLWQQAVHP